MALEQIGTTLAVGAGTITGSYICESREDHDKNVVYEDVDDEDGALESRVIFKREQKVTLNLICIEGAAPETDFPTGDLAAHTDFTNYFVDSCVVTRTKGAKRVTVNLTNIGQTL